MNPPPKLRPYRVMLDYWEPLYFQTWEPRYFQTLAGAIAYALREGPRAKATPQFHHRALSDDQSTVIGDWEPFTPDLDGGA